MLGCSLDIEDFHLVRLVRSVFVGAVDHSNLGSWLRQSHGLGLLNDLGNDVILSLECCKFVSNNTSHAVHLSHHWSVDGAAQDWHLWSVF